MSSRCQGIGNRKRSDASRGGETPVESNTETWHPRRPAAINLSDVAISEDAGAAGSDVKDGNYFAKRFTRTLRRDKSTREDKPAIAGLRLLHASTDPLLDLIFVHGLKGHPVKTWHKSGDPQSFWPQLWIPTEPRFRHVNVHTFGYEADFSNTKVANVLSVHDFGQSLFEQMRNSPYLRNNEKGHIIMLGHSLGGLVIKQAFLLAQEAEGFRNRIRTIFFLGTPHRGSDYAKILSRILSLSPTSSPNYVKDLNVDSVAMQLLNEQFSKLAHDIPIYSFYEIMKTNLGLKSDVVVEKKSAILGPGFKNERVQYLSTDHKELCKFPSLEDSNYLRLTDALAVAVDDLLDDGRNGKEQETREKLRMLQNFLSLSERLEEQYDAMEGSCQWIDNCVEFQIWMDTGASPPDQPTAESPRQLPAFIWVHANPGTGKTILAAHVIKQLQGLNLDCSYHYFHIGGKASQSLGFFLRSLAFQMAIRNAVVRDLLVSLSKETSMFNVDDCSSTWAKIFSKGIFQIRGLRPQYWVIDAMDECLKYQEFFAMLKGENPYFPLRILITSRKVSDMARLCRPLESSWKLSSLQIPESASMHDISRYVEARMDNLPVSTTEERTELAAQIIRRSNACFLWVRLVLDELEQVYSSESILQVLRSIPDSMVPYYERTTAAMAENKHEKHISKAVLLWTVGSTRRLTTSELSQALKLDIGINLPNTAVAIEGLCGQLLAVDKHSTLINTTHPTVREFLLMNAAGEFRIRRSVAHERIALVCLKILTGPEMQPTRNRPGANRREPLSPLLEYALTQFSEHVQGASSEEHMLVSEVDGFLRTNALTWIEHVARKEDLHVLMRTSKNLKAFVDRRAKYRSPFKHQVNNIADWSTDLSRLWTKFGDALLKNPSAINYLIPPLCPLSSAIHRQFGARPATLKVVGFNHTAWDDCLAEVTFGNEIASTVACGDSLVAVGMASGLIYLYNHQSFQQVEAIRCKWPVDAIYFAKYAVVVCTIKTIALLDTKGNKMWEKKSRSRCSFLTVVKDIIYTVTESGAVLTWAMADGELLSNDRFEYRNHQTEREHNQLKDRAPSVASISPDMDVLALGYRGGTVCLWDFQSHQFIAWVLDDMDRQPAKIMFNPNPNINLLLIIYTNHTMSLYETGWGQLVQTYTPPRETGIMAATCSSDGRTLATANFLGHLQIWDFETLTLLYHLDAPSSSTRKIRFTSGGTGIVDISAQSMRVWSPTALIRKNMEEEESILDDAVVIPACTGEYRESRATRITALRAHPTLPLVFTGSFSGSVHAYSSETGQDLGELYSHHLREMIHHIAISKNGSIISADSVGVLMHRLNLTKLSSSKITAHIILEQRVRPAVKQLCYSDSGEFVIVSNSTSDFLYSKDGSLLNQRSLQEAERCAWRWVPVPAVGNGSDFLLINDWKAVRYSGDSFPNPVQGSDIELQHDSELGDAHYDFVAGVVVPDGQTLVLECQHHVAFQEKSTTYVFELGKTNGTILTPSCRLKSDFCKQFISISSMTKNLNFLHRNLWLSSLSLQNLSIRNSSYSHHFFVPNEYVASRNGVNVRLVATAGDDIVFCIYDKLAFVRNWARFRDEKEVDLLEGI